MTFVNLRFATVPKYTGSDGSQTISLIRLRFRFVVKKRHGETVFQQLDQDSKCPTV